METPKTIKNNIYSIVLFYSIAILLRYIATKTTWLDITDNTFIQICLRGIGPTIGALIAFKVFGIKNTYSLAGKLKPLLLSFIVFIVLPVLGFAIVGIKESENVTVTSNIFIAGAKLSFYFFVYGILEEMGWRVFLQNQLDFLNQYIKYLIIGVLWFVWHLNFGVTTPNIIFFFLLIFASWGIGKIGDKTKSVLAVGAFHTLYNLFSVDYFESKDKLIVLSLSVVIWVSYILFYDKVKKLMKIENK